MGLFDITDDRLKDLYHEAELDTNRGFVDTRNHPNLDRALVFYAKEHNCSYDDALIFAKTGKKMGGLAD